ncbi:hypothetical protein [Haloarcula sp. 1CSR25-25]|jgi:hypothetical protein|uniref:hypothetical protein n=1 Tax=Haloarcula sp. 1CSR25-25 TaxID=2862545 RepID=UPI0028944841|nr:hypothetical protein [Haloarcula sp. 1CSR25-25]MDT3437777.1 hypothetical protein [Haloarcula sp. 1CSR25-25]
MSEPTQHHELKDKYRVQDIPRLGPARNAAKETEIRVHVGDEEFVTVAIGDAVIRESSIGKEVRVILETYTHGFVTWILDEKRYSYYPRDHLEEDLTVETYDITIKENPWEMAN